MESQRGFTLLETIATLGIVSLLLLAGLRLATLARAPGATANAATQLDAAIALVRSLARASGNGATLLALPRTDTRGNVVLGFRIVLYRGRPNAAGAATIARALPLVTDASLREASLGSPPFALFFRGDGSAVGIAHPTLTGASSHPQFATIAAEPPCPSTTGIALSLTRNGATETRAIVCPPQSKSAAGPQPSMTPNPPTLAPHALLFPWPTAPTQWFSIAEFGYRRWFAAMGGAMAGFACSGNGAAVVAFPTTPPYSGPQAPADAQSTPAPPNAPYAYAVAASNAAGAMDDAPAHFPVQPVAAGLCNVPLVDAFAQSSDPWGNPLVVAMQVMGWLTLSHAANAATSRSAPLAIGALTAAGQSFTVDASKSFDNDPAGITFTGLTWNSSACDASKGGALAFAASGNNTAGSGPSGTATHAFVITDQTPPATALTCTGTLTDQYGEPPVSFTTNVAAGASAMLTWPAKIVVMAGGGTIGFVAPPPTARGSLGAPLVATIWGSPAIADAVASFGRLVAVNPPPGGTCVQTQSCPIQITAPATLPISFTSAGSMTLSAQETGFAGTMTATSSDPSVATVSSGTITGTETTSFTVSAIGNGVASITVTGNSSTDVSVSVNIPPPPCYAKAYTASGALDTNEPADTLGYGSDANGCITHNGVPAAQAVIVASSATSTTTYQGTAPLNCNNIASLGQGYPLNASGVPSGAQVDFPVIPGSTGGSCTVSIGDPNPPANPTYGNGLAHVDVVGPCVNGATLAIGDSCLASIAGGGGGNPGCSEGSSGAGWGSGTLYYTAGPTGSVTPTTTRVGISGSSTPLFTRTAPGTITITGYAEWVHWSTGSGTSAGKCTAVFSFIPDGTIALN
uniref:Prepilin-type N-terminal cleavage/methylation domain-containing protein n=1 Tax=mine drainage metagenome TaxID=410659 RepID=E6Q443_9ZZZZ